MAIIYVVFHREARTGFYWTRDQGSVLERQFDTQTYRLVWKVSTTSLKNSGMVNLQWSKKPLFIDKEDWIEYLEMRSLVLPCNKLWALSRLGHTIVLSFSLNMEYKRAALDLFQLRFKITFKSKPLLEEQNTQSQPALVYVSHVARMLEEGQGDSTAKLVQKKRPKNFKSKVILSFHKHTLSFFWVCIL